MKVTDVEHPLMQADLKTAAFKHLLQGPQSFRQFASRFGVSLEDARGWVDDALANLEQAAEDSHKKNAVHSQILTHAERRTLLEGKLPHEYQA